MTLCLHIQHNLLNDCVRNDTQPCKYHNILFYEEGWSDRWNQKPLKAQCKDVEKLCGRSDPKICYWLVLMQLIQFREH